MLGYQPYEDYIPKPGSKLEIYLIPDYFFSAFLAKYNIEEIHEYKKLRQIGSITDIATLLALGNIVNTAHSAVLANDVNSILRQGGMADSDKLSEEESTELANSVRPMANSPKFKQEVLARYLDRKDDQDAVCCDATEWTDNRHSLTDQHKKAAVVRPFKIISNRNSLYISVEEGFTTYISKKKEFLEFVSAVLKAAYDCASFEAVNNTEFYKAYLMALRAKD